MTTITGATFVGAEERTDGATFDRRAGQSGR